MTLSALYWFRLRRVARLSVSFAVFGVLMPAAAFGEPQSRTPTPPPAPSPTPSSRQNLSEYARGRDLQSASKGQKETVVITDENIEDLASGVELTSVTGSTASRPVATPSPESPRTFWRGRVKEQQRRIQTLEENNKLADREISGLWLLFYACDEPDDREKNIRLRLNKRLDARTRLRVEMETAQSDFEELLAEARRNGALPGWFRDLLK